MCCMLYWRCGPRGRRERRAQRAASGEAARPTTRSAICQQGKPPAAKSPLDVRCANSQSPPCGRFPEGPRTDLIACIPFASAFQRPLTRQHNRPDRVWWFSRPISAFRRPSTQHLLHCRFPSSFHFVPVCWQLRRACYPDFARAMAPRSVPSGVVQRTGCSACGLGYPHQVW